jgi:integrase
MGRLSSKLTAKTVASLSKPGRYSDGDRLYLQISAAGRKQFVFLYAFGGRQREMGLGTAGTGGLSLAEARVRADEARRLLRDGKDPIEARKAATAARISAETTFGMFADTYIASHEKSWSNPKHIAQWHMTLGDAYCSSIRGKPIGSIGTPEVLSVLKPVWQRVPETARRLRMRLERVLDAARVAGLYSGENPARWKGHLDHLLPRMNKGRAQHHAALPFAKVPGFMRALEERPGTAALAFRFLVLTACRTGEVLSARWSEMDLNKSTWTIPPERMKARREHRVPLSPGALAVLKSAEGKHEEFVFPGPEEKGPLSSMALLMLLRRMNMENATAHGFRSSFRDWVAECTSFPSEVAEMALAHVVENQTEAAYRRGDLFEKRKKLMEAWGQFCKSAEKGVVVQFERAKP